MVMIIMKWNGEGRGRGSVAIYVHSFTTCHVERQTIDVFHVDISGSCPGSRSGVRLHALPHFKVAQTPIPLRPCRRIDGLPHHRAPQPFQSIVCIADSNSITSPSVRVCQSDRQSHSLPIPTPLEIGSAPKWGHIPAMSIFLWPPKMGKSCLG
jgi:hypothetical protein